MALTARREGNYLLLETGDWACVRPLLYEAWYVDVDEDLRVRSLVQRHVDYGKARDEAARVERGDRRGDPGEGGRPRELRWLAEPDA